MAAPQPDVGAPVVGMRHVHLKVRDVERSARFYEDALGLQRAGAKYDGAMLMLTVPGQDDLLTLSDARRGGDVDNSTGHIGENGGIDHFGFSLAERNTLDEVIERVVAAGGELVRRFEIAPGFPSAFVRDPDGYAFQL
jgi:catechol 2,3-dioxygenase-like lactoylglutathione lyase family enzyme